MDCGQHLLPWDYGDEWSSGQYAGAILPCQSGVASPSINNDDDDNDILSGYEVS